MGVIQGTTSNQIYAKNDGCPSDKYAIVRKECLRHGLRGDSSGHYSTSFPNVDEVDGSVGGSQWISCGRAALLVRDALKQ